MCQCKCIIFNLQSPPQYPSEPIHKNWDTPRPKSTAHSQHYHFCSAIDSDWGQKVLSCDAANCSSICCMHTHGTDMHRPLAVVGAVWRIWRKDLIYILKACPEQPNRQKKHQRWKPDLSTGRRAGQADPCASWICVAVLVEEFAAALAPCSNVKTSA